MSSGTPPEGWDQADPEMVEAMAGTRRMYLALIANGFTMQEAATIIGSWIVACGNSATSS